MSQIVRQHPGRSLGALACLAMMGGIAGNAVLLQKGRHPAPLFGVPAKAARPVLVEPAPQPVPRPVAADLPQAPAAAADEGDTAPAALAAPRLAAPVAKPERRQPKVAAPARPAAPKTDDIARLIEGKAPATPDGADTSVMAAQRALAKLGYAVKPDGHLGAATREALQKFAQERRLASDGTLSPKLLHALEHAAGTSRG